MQARYEVIFRDTSTGNKWSMFFTAENFADTEEQAVDALTKVGTQRINLEYEELIEIKKDYES